MSSGDGESENRVAGSMIPSSGSVVTSVAVFATDAAALVSDVMALTLDSAVSAGDSTAGGGIEDVAPGTTIRGRTFFLSFCGSAKIDESTNYRRTITNAPGGAGDSHATLIETQRRQLSLRGST